MLEAEAGQDQFGIGCRRIGHRCHGDVCCLGPVHQVHQARCWHQIGLRKVPEFCLFPIGQALVFTFRHFGKETPHDLGVGEPHHLGTIILMRDALAKLGEHHVEGADVDGIGIGERAIDIEEQRSLEGLCHAMSILVRRPISGRSFSISALARAMQPSVGV